MKKSNLFILILGMTFLFTSCSKQGATGPAGPAGAAGSAGTAGPTGQTGPTGPMGNGNIKDTVITVVNWTASTNYDYTDVTDPQITSSIVSKGEVSVFWGSDGLHWDVLNWVSLNPAGYSFTYQYYLNTVALYFGPATNPNTFFSVSSLMFRIVCITNNEMKRHPNTNWKDLSQVNAIMSMENNNSKN